MEHSNVKLVSTTEDPTDDLHCHIALNQEKMFTRVITAFRPDQAMFLEKDGFSSYLDQLEAVSGVTVDTFEHMLDALEARLKYFKEITSTTVSDDGIIYNKELLKKAGYSADDITNFDSFKKVVEDITANKDKLGFSAFTSAGMDGSSDWRFKTHLANLPIYYEYKDEGIDNTDAIKGTYLDNYRQIWDLYINNATCKPTELSTKTADDATADFVTGDAVFYQNGTWEYNNIKDVGDDNLGILPIYIGVEGEEDQGICTGTENYWCVNSKASEDDIQATLDFMNWCVTSDDGVKAMCKDMGFTIPFKKNLKSDNVLVNEANKYTEDGKTPVSWNFSTMPSEEWKNGVGSALTSYAADPTDANWAKVTTAFVDGWAKEAAAAK